MKLRNPNPLRLTALMIRFRPSVGALVKRLSNQLRISSSFAGYKAAARELVPHARRTADVLLAAATDFDDSQTCEAPASERGPHPGQRSPLKRGEPEKLR